MLDVSESGVGASGGVSLRLRSLCLAIAGMLTVTGVTEAQTPRSASVPSDAEVLRPDAPRHARKAVLFRTPYLSRAADAVLERYRPPEAEISVDPPTAEGAAAAYARRYGISRELAQKIVDTAQAEGLDPELGFRLVRVESRFKSSARGPQGALGLTQLMPSTARLLDRSLDTEGELLDPSRNLRVGFRYLRQMIERYDGNVRLGLLAYNRGEVAVDRAIRGGRDPENGYSHKVLGTRGANPYTGKGLLTGR